ncbi:hypothetical protein [Yoonia sp.]|uniref:hypothetical protein n=1 Tax=Yoonia sp. TaxID=2212373 RepID=UPI002FDAA5A9
MMKSLVAGVMAFSLTLASALPAQANGLDREDVGKLLLGLLAVGVVGAAIENNQRREDIPVVRQDRGSWADLNQPRSRPDSRRDDRRLILPHQCLQTLRTRYGDLRLFGERCLERNYRFSASLPERCEVRIYTHDGPRSGYDPLCLREQGYRTNRRH